MVKIKTISRTEDSYTRECKGDVVKVFRNLDPALHPFEKAREYTRALQATKLDKVFAKPFLGECAQNHEPA
jgi:DDB1- and CUL4-associated factor 13